MRPRSAALFLAAIFLAAAPCSGLRIGKVGIKHAGPQPDSRAARKIYCQATPQDRAEAPAPEFTEDVAVADEKIAVSARERRRCCLAAHH